MVAASVTADPDGARSTVAESFGVASSLPSYRAVLDRGGVTGVEDTLAAGDEDAVARALDDMFAVGATDIVVMPVGKAGDEERTLAVLGELARARAD
jgi:alkanesulfonate monooxygenase SsuD/methylene tetrahydromethanopterin reductase-like flavin-dependent oxidoreductase (luciferase family)